MAFPIKWCFAISCRIVKYVWNVMGIPWIFIMMNGTSKNNTGIKSVRIGAEILAKDTACKKKDEWFRNSSYPHSIYEYVSKKFGLFFTVFQTFSNCSFETSSSDVVGFGGGG